jgi:hypothetical protein
VRNRSGRPQRRRRKIGAMKRRRMNTAMRWKEEREMLQSGFSSGFSIRTQCTTLLIVWMVLTVWVWGTMTWMGSWMVWAA